MVINVMNRMKINNIYNILLNIFRELQNKLFFKETKKLNEY